MRIVTVFIGLLTVTVIQAQKLYDVKLDDCLLKFEMESLEEWIYYEKNDSLMVLDFLNGLDEKRVERIRGGIQLQIMVDTIQDICCLSYTNKTNLSDRRLEVPVRVKQMEGWQRHDGVRPDENLCALVSILFEKDKYTVVRTGYDRNRGSQILYSLSYPKYEPDTTAVDNKE